jgi:transposase
MASLAVLAFDSISQHCKDTELPPLINLQALQTFVSGEHGHPTSERMQGKRTHAPPRGKKGRLSSSSNLRQLQLISLLREEHSMSVTSIASLMGLSYNMVWRAVHPKQEQRQPIMSAIGKSAVRILAERERVTALVGECADSFQGVLKTSAIQRMLQERHNIDLSAQQVTRLLKLKLGYSYRRISAVTAAMNSDRCKEERKRAASEFIITLSQPHRVIINIDESIVRTTFDAKYCWQRKGISNIVTGGQRMNAVSLIMAISNRGDIYFTAN